MKTSTMNTVYVNLMLAENDYRNGEQQGFVDAISVDDLNVQIEGFALLTRKDGKLYFDGLLGIPYRTCSMWVGNWCWNQYTIEIKYLMRLLNWLRAKEWNLTEGIDKLYNRWYSGKPFKFSRKM